MNNSQIHISVSWAGIIGGVASASALILANQGVLSLSPFGTKLVAIATAVSSAIAAIGPSIVGAVSTSDNSTPLRSTK